MWRSKKFIIIAVLTVLVLGVALGGVAIAQADEEENAATQTANVSLLERVAAIYEKNTGVSIDPQALKQAFIEAGQAIKVEAKDRLLDKLVADGRITQEQADALDTWLDSRPSFPTDEFKQWWDARPDVPGLFGEGNQGGIGPFGGMHRGFGRFGGMMGGRFGGWCAPGANLK